MRGLFTHDDGRPMSIREAKTALMDEIAKGHRFIPIGDVVAMSTQTRRLSDSMKIDKLSAIAQEGLRKWATFQHDDALLFDAIASLPQEWAWICFQLGAAEDNPEWFPKGKWATIQFIQQVLVEEAVAERRPRPPNEPSIACPKCGRVSYNPNDIANQYCGACHAFHGDLI